VVAVNAQSEGWRIGLFKPHEKESLASRAERLLVEV